MLTLSAPLSVPSSAHQIPHRRSPCLLLPVLRACSSSAHPRLLLLVLLRACSSSTPSCLLLLCSSVPAPPHHQVMHSSCKFIAITMGGLLEMFLLSQQHLDNS
ncbi:hypothetical protein Sjap_023891 [Stephania japonica]|uniref:Uncharacterized protein n=1 Tax=Stephania japonica TaxID=461633 RepID=A0AAP0EL38_9MAGN